MRFDVRRSIAKCVVLVPCLYGAIAHLDSIVHGAENTDRLRHRTDIEASEEQCYHFGAPLSPDAVIRLGRWSERYKQDGESLFWSGYARLNDPSPEIASVGWKDVEKASSMGIPAATDVLARHFLDDKNDSATVERGLEMLRRAADAGDPRALNGMATIYATGIAGIHKDLTTAAHYFERSLNEGYYPSALYLSSVLARSGESERSEALVKKAAELGDCQAIRLLAEHYGSGDPIRSETEFLRYVQRGALWSDPESTRRYALKIDDYWANPKAPEQYDNLVKDHLTPTKRDDPLVHRLLIQAERSGDSIAQLSVADSQIWGSRGSTVQMQRGIQTLNRAVKSGDSMGVAHFFLAHAYFAGRGVKQDIRHARTLMNFAAQSHLPDAVKWIAENGQPSATSQSSSQRAAEPSTQPNEGVDQQWDSAVQDRGEMEDWWYRIDPPPAPQTIDRLHSNAVSGKAEPTDLTWAALAAINGMMPTVTPAEWKPWILSAAEHHVPLAMAVVGNELLRGIRISPDHALGLKLLNDAAADNEPSAYYFLGARLHRRSRRPDRRPRESPPIFNQGNRLRPDTGMVRRREK